MTLHGSWQGKGSRHSRTILREQHRLSGSTEPYQVWILAVAKAAATSSVSQGPFSRPVIESTTSAVPSSASESLQPLGLTSKAPPPPKAASPLLLPASAAPPPPKAASPSLLPASEVPVTLAEASSSTDQTLLRGEFVHDCLVDSTKLMGKVTFSSECVAQLVVQFKPTVLNRAEFSTDCRKVVYVSWLPEQSFDVFTLKSYLSSWIEDQLM